MPQVVWSHLQRVLQVIVSVATLNSVHVQRYKGGKCPIQCRRWAHNAFIERRQIAIIFHTLYTLSTSTSSSLLSSLLVPLITSSFTARTVFLTTQHTCLFFVYPRRELPKYTSTLSDARTIYLFLHSFHQSIFNLRVAQSKTLKTFHIPNYSI